MSASAKFVRSYTESDYEKIRFAWNGKHAKEFLDSNQNFRWEVVSYCIGNPEAASLLLLEKLFLADAEWSRQAWSAPQHFPNLAAIFLQHGQEKCLESFVQGAYACFDTFAACSFMNIPRDLSERLMTASNDLALQTSDERTQKSLKSASELFSKLANGTASVGFGTVTAGTLVKNIRIVRPNRLQRLWRSFLTWIKARTA